MHTQALRDYILNTYLNKQPPPGFDDDYNLIDDAIMDSLAIINTVTYLEQQYGIQFDDGDIMPEHFSSVNALAAFVQHKIAQFATQLDQANEAKYIEKNKALKYKDELYPMPVGQSQLLSLVQYESWFHQYHNPQLTYANLPFGFKLQGTVDISTLQASLDIMAQRHAILRTRYVLEQNQARQVQEPSSAMLLAVLDWSELTADAQQQALLNWMREEVQQRPFDLSKLPLWRGYLVKINQYTHYVLFVLHHIQADNWSSQIFENELWQCYNALSQNQPITLPPLPIQYADYAAWQRRNLTSSQIEEKRAYWDKILAQPPAKLQLSKAQKQGLASPSNLVISTLNSWQTKQLKSFSQQQGVTIFTTLLTTLAILLYPYSDKSGVIIGVPLGNKRTHPWLEKLIGHFAGRASLRIDFTDKINIKTLLQHVQDTLQDALQHQDMTYAQLQQLLHPEEPYRTNQPYQVVLNFLPVSSSSKLIKLNKNLQVEPLKNLSYETSIPELHIAIMRSEGSNHTNLSLNWRYRVDLFQESQVQTLAARFNAILDLMQQSQVTLDAIVSKL